MSPAETSLTRPPGVIFTPHHLMRMSMSIPLNNHICAHAIDTKPYPQSRPMTRTFIPTASIYTKKLAQNQKTPTQQANNHEVHEHNLPLSLNFS